MEILELVNTIIEMKNSRVAHSIFEMVEERIIEHEDKLIEIIQSEEQRGGKIFLEKE